MSPSTVSENGVVGQATSFDLTLNGETPYTYTQTFGNICTVTINENIATVTITPTEVGLLTGSITFNEEATCNININVQGVYTVSPSTVTQTEANQRCYTNIKNNGITIDYNNIHNSDLILDYVKNNATDVIVARGGVDNSASNVTTHNAAMLVRSGNSSGNINFMAYTNELPNGEYTVKFRYTDSNSDTHELYVTFVMAIPEPPTVVTVSPTTVSENGVVGQATSFNLTLSGGSTYTYTQTFGNICSVDINDNIATVTITPIASGTLTGSITFNEEATCNITIAVSEPIQEYSLTPATVSDSVMAGNNKDFTLTLSVGSNFDYADIYYDNNVYGEVTLSDSEMTSAGTITVNYYQNTEYEGEDISDIFTVTATCHRTGGLADVVLSSTFTINII